MIPFLLVAALASTPDPSAASAGAATDAMAKPAAAETKPLKVSIDYDKKADFSHIKTYSWQPGIAMDDTLLEARMLARIDAALTARGWQKLEPKSKDKPDAHLSYSVSGKKKTDPARLGRPSWSSGDFGHKSQMLSTGSLVLEVADAAAGKAIWSGVATGVLGQRTMSAEEAIDSAVDQLLKDFPPKGGE